MQYSSATERLVFADSLNRDEGLYPNGNSYILHLTTPIKNIERVDLVSARVPNTMYNITNGTGIFTIGSNVISIRNGFYSAYGMAAAVTSNALVTLDYLPDEGKFTFSNPGAFSITIQSEEFAKIVGLSNATTHTASLATALDPAYMGKYIIRSTTMVDLTLNDYVFLDIDELRTPHNVDARKLDGASGTVSGSNANRAFAPIVMDVGSACIKNFHENKDYRVSVAYPEPINVLQRLTVRWYDKDGALLNFRGWDTNAFVLRIHVKPEPERTLPPPPPLQDVELKRIIDAMTLALPPPPKEESKKFKIPWFLLVLATLIGIFIWKTFGTRSSPVGTVQPPQVPQAPVKFI
jgi:hypothetical protein